MVTSALRITAPFSSLTDPVIRPVVWLCAKADSVKIVDKQIAKMDVAPYLVFIVCLLVDMDSRIAETD
jgi:hypothetical protein